MTEIDESSPAVRNVGDRLTPALAAGGFAAVPKAFLEHYHTLNVTSAEAMVIVHLLSYKWDKRNPFPRLRVLANKMGLSETSVRTHTRNLEDKKLLKRISRPGHSNAFDLTPLFRKLEELQLTETAKNPTRKKKKVVEV